MEFSVQGLSSLLLYRHFSTSPYGVDHTEYHLEAKSRLQISRTVGVTRGMALPPARPPACGGLSLPQSPSSRVPKRNITSDPGELYFGSIESKSQFTSLSYLYKLVPQTLFVSLRVLPRVSRLRHRLQKCTESALYSCRHASTSPCEYHKRFFESE